jgi:hypothetical protein
LAELGEISFVLAEVAKVLEGIEGSLDLKLKVNRHDTTFPLVFPLSFIEGNVFETNDVISYLILNKDTETTR